MVLRLVFDRRDLQRVRLARGADPMWESMFGLQKAQLRAVPAPLVGWRREVGERLAGARHGVGAFTLLRYLVGPAGDSPDFLTPPDPVTEVDAGCEAMLCTPPHLLGADLAAVFARRPAPLWVRSLAEGDRDVLGEVVRAVRDSHDLLVAPHWADMCEVVAADHAMRARQLATHGVGALLAHLPGVLSWDGQVLCTRYPEDRTVHLAGRGVVLLPSYLCWGNPVTYLDPELPPVLVYQALGPHSLPRSVPDVNVPSHLVALLGRTRAECLRVLLAPRTTTELAEHLGTSVGTASKQATVLRENGLVTSSRHGAAVLHSTTPLGVALLVGTQPDR